MINLLMNHQHEQLQQGKEIDHCQHLNEQLTVQIDSEEIKKMKKKKNKRNQKQKEIQIQAYSIIQTQTHQIDIIANILQRSTNIISEQIYHCIYNQQKKIQNKVYLGLIQNRKSYLQFHLQQNCSSNILKYQLQYMFKSISQKIEADIYKNKYGIQHKHHWSKNQTLNGQKSSQLKETQQRIKSKVSKLKNQITQNDIFNAYNPKYYQFTNIRTKNAYEFVNGIKKEQQQRRFKKSERRKEKQRLQFLSQQKNQKKQEQKKMVKQEELKKKIKRKEEENAKQNQKRIENQRKYLQFVKSSNKNKPLFIKKQESYQHNVVLTQHKRKMDIMNYLSEQKKSINAQELKEHQRKYEELKKIDQDRRMEMINLKQTQQEQIASRNYYLSKFHKCFSNELKGQSILIQKQQKERKKQLLKKQILFCENVQQKYKPIVDEEKKNQMEQFIEIACNKYEKPSSKKSRQDGHKNLKILHKFIEDSRAKGNLRNSQTKKQQYDVSYKSRYANYLQEIRDEKNKSSYNYRSLGDKVSDKNMKQIQLEAKLYEQNARKYQKLLNNTNIISIDDYMNKKKKVEEQYIKSIHAKSIIINRSNKLFQK